MVDETARFIFRVKRRLGREFRKRSVHLILLWDRKRLASTRGEGGDPRGLLVQYGRVHGGSDLVPNAAWTTPEEAEAIIAQADRACAHTFDLLGSGPVTLGPEIDWHADFKNGYRWPANIHHLRIRWDDVPAGVDIKVPWELSRCLHFSTLGLADRFAGDGRYYREFKAQVRHWIATNPCGFGVNWMCTMDVAIRAVNWLNAVVLFNRRIEQDDDVDFVEVLVESLWLHGRHIARNLEWQGPRSSGLGNHFLANICGLVAIGGLFAAHREGQRHLAFARKWFENEIRRQVFDDGASYETSTSYHRLALEMFLWADMCTEHLRAPFSQGYRDRLERMAAFVKAYTSPTGVAAQFGDNDSGRLLSAGIGRGGDHRYLIDGTCGFGGNADRLLLRGTLPTPTPATEHRHTFPTGGYWFAQTGAMWIGVRAGVVSHGGAHAHADQLSFVLAVGGEDLIVDPGTGVYSADVAKRNRYRSTAAHNACRINDWEPNTFTGGKPGLFRMLDDTRTEVLEWCRDENLTRFRGRHHGYARHRDGLIYERVLILEQDHLEIRDRFEHVEPGDRLEWSLQFAPGVELTDTGGEILACLNSRRIRIVADSGVEAGIVASYHSPEYGVELPASRLTLRALVGEAGDKEYAVRMESMPGLEGNV